MLCGVVTTLVHCLRRTYEAAISESSSAILVFPPCENAERSRVSSLSIASAAIAQAVESPRTARHSAQRYRWHRSSFTSALSRRHRLF